MTHKDDPPSQGGCEEQKEAEATDGDQQDTSDHPNPDAANHDHDDDSETKDDDPKTKDNDPETKDDDPETKDDDPETKDDDSESTAEDDNAQYPQWPKRFQDIRPEVRECNYYQFKNFYHESEMQAAVYALYGDHNLLNDIKKENDRRKSLKNGATIRDATSRGGDQGIDSSLGLGGSSIENKVLHRIRIRSPFILRHLHKLVGETYDESRDFVFFRPFRILIHLQSQMEEDLKKLREKWGDSATSESAEPNEDGSPSPDLDLESPELLDSKHAFTHMEAYVQFINDKVMPLQDQFQNIDPEETSQAKVAFEDLSFLFREGEYVYRPLPSEKKKSGDPSSMGSASLSSSCQKLWRVYSVSIPSVPNDADEALYERDPSTKPRKNNSDEALESASDDDDMTSRDFEVIKVFCYYIDFDGDLYTPMYRCVRINRYSGEKLIRSLPIYPVKYLDKGETIMKKKRASGEAFEHFIAQKHVYHFGWTINHFPTGTVIDDTDKYPEFIDSELIVDFQEAFQNFPSWKDGDHHTPAISTTLTPSWGTNGCGQTFVDSLLWSTNSKTKHENVHDCVKIIDQDNVGILRRNAYLAKDPFLVGYQEGNFVVPSGNDLCLLPTRLVGFSLKERKFVNVSINSLRPIGPQSQVLDRLKINGSHKKMVLSLVREHLRLKNKREQGSDVLGQDFIKGKGSGLVFLLHGVPGVGKTATAEAVAQENQKPLFAITCGDLGTQPSAVESNLNRIFRWATIWDCILLLDEADVFFTRRNPSDLERNALVTVFLRMLEYYSGILFLTTNRVGIMDEAFKSRIHMSLYYPPLDLVQTQQIFADNIDRLQQKEAKEEDERHKIRVDSGSIMMWAKQHFEGNPELGRWNGRQIRNAFQTAASLAHFDALDSQPPEVGAERGVLNYTQFDKVFEATRQFDVYMAKVKRATDHESARKEMTRFDEYSESGNPLHKEPAYGIHRGYNHAPIASRNQHPATFGQDPSYGSSQVYSQPRSPGGPHLSADYGRGGAMHQAYHNTPMAPSQMAAQSTMTPDSAVSLGFGFPTQTDLAMRDGRSPRMENSASRLGMAPEGSSFGMFRPQ